jgi:hypothetical protein
MRLRLVKRGWLAGMMVLILVCVAFWVVWLWLPSLVERRVTERLIAMGFEEPRLRIPSVGLRYLQLTNFSAVHGPWRIQLDRGAARYRLKDLLRSELRALDLDGLRIQLDLSRLEEAPDAVRPDLSDLRRMALELLGRVPLRSLSVSNGLFHVINGAQEATLFFTTELSNTVETGPTLFALYGWNEETDIRVEGKVERATGAELTAHVELNDGEAWLGLAQLGERTARLTDLWIGEASTTFHLRLPPDQNILLVTGIVAGLDAGIREVSVRFDATSYAGRWREGESEIDFTIQQIVLRHEQFGEMWFSELDGRVSELEREGIGHLSGQVQLMRSPHLVMHEPIPFGAGARREDDITSIELRLDFLNTSLSGPHLPEGLALSGDAAGAAYLRKDAMSWGTGFDLAFSVPTWDVIEGVTVLEPRVRLTRPATAEASPAVLAQIQFEANSLHYRGIRIEHPHGVGEVLSTAGNTAPGSGSTSASRPGGGSGFGRTGIASEEEEHRQPAHGSLDEWRPDAAWLRGEATLGEAGFGYEVQVWQAGERRTGLELAGQFVLGTVPLSALKVPEELTGGKAMEVTGEVAARGRFRFASGEEFGWWPVVGLALDQVWYGDHEVTDVRLRMDWMDRQIARVELAQASYLGGQIRAAPFQWDLESRNFEMELELEGLRLDQLARQIPQFAGSVEGFLDGRLAIGLEDGEIAIRGGRLELDRERAGRLEYPAEGLLTAGLPAGSDEQRRLALVEDGLKDLRLEALTVDLYDPGDPETPVKISLEGTSVSERAIVPIQFHLNLRGDVDPLLRWWQRGNFEFDSGQVLDAGR